MSKSIQCTFFNNNKCILLTTLLNPNGYYVPDSFCKSVCGPNCPLRQRGMLHRHGIYVNFIPNGPEQLNEYLKTHKIHYDEIAEHRLEKSQEQKARLEKKQKEIESAVAQLPPLTQRLVSLDQWVKDIAVPFEKKTRLLFTTKQHKLERDAICRQCPHMVKENDTMSCSKCGCRMGKLVADPNEPNPHEIMGKLKAMGDKGKTADAIRIKSASWYAAKRCGYWQEQDRWAEVDGKYLTDEQLKIRDELYGT